MPQLHFRPDGAYLTTLAASSVRVIPSRKRVKAFGEIFSHRENYVSSWSNGSSFNSVQATPPQGTQVASQIHSLKFAKFDEIAGSS